MSIGLLANDIMSQQAYGAIQVLRNARGGGGICPSVTKRYEGVGGYLPGRYVTSIFFF